MTRVTQRQTTQNRKYDWDGEYGNSGAGYKTKFAGLYDLYLWFKAQPDYKDYTINLPNDKGAGSSFTMYISWLKERGYYTLAQNLYQQRVGYFYQGGGRFRSFYAIIISIVVGGVLLTVLFYTIRKLRNKRKKR
jgi:hypothetical protein